MDVGLCRYGLNFLRIDDTTVVNGMSITDWSPTTAAWRRELRRQGSVRVSSSQVERIRRALSGLSESYARDIAEEKRAMLAQYRESSEFQADAIKMLGPEMRQSMGQFHDYRQLASSIVQNVNVLLGGSSKEEFERLLDGSSREIQAIYWSAQLMLTKLDAALFLMHPERINDRTKITTFRLHGLITKYEKIYEGAFERRGVRLSMAGQSYGNIRANPDAVGVIPHAIIDNCLKYAPVGSDAKIYFSEESSEIRTDFSSFGPRIHPEEVEEIFGLFVRGREAAQINLEGTGFGLALAKIVADHIGASLYVRQEGEPNPDGTYWTTFSAVFQKSS